MKVETEHPDVAEVVILMSVEEAQSLYISIDFDSPYTAQRKLHAAMREWFATHG